MNEIIVNCELYYLKQYNDQYIIEDVDGFAIIAVPDNNLETATKILKNHLNYCIKHEII
jgi:hypothetical protein